MKKIRIRCCVAYGFQENENIEKKEAFWKYLDGEVRGAKETGAGLVIQFDGNLWAGEKIMLLLVMPIPEESQVMLPKIIKTEIYSYNG